MDFVLVLHSHLPYVLNHGRWPHGSDWLCEAAIDTYLPLYEKIAGLADRGVPAPITLGITPVLANQLASPAFNVELERYFAQRLEHCREARPSLRASDPDLVPLVAWWESHLVHLRDLFRSLNGDLAAAFRSLQDRGIIEIISSAATHGFLPLLARDESIRLQLGTGRAEHKRLFGADPKGCWLPECAYRPAGRWEPIPGKRPAEDRLGIDEFLSAAGYSFFITDAHLAHAGVPLEQYGGQQVVPGGERFAIDVEMLPETGTISERRTPYRAYRATAGALRKQVAALVRDPRSTRQVWSRQQGYPGDEWYLEFHKIRWPHGLKLWRVTGPELDLGLKRSYEPARALERSRAHASHFAQVLEDIARGQSAKDAVVVAPFDTELFGHWWFEGVDFMAALYGELGNRRAINPVTGSDHLKRHPPASAIRLAPGSWGARGDYSMWLNPDTAWTWERLWALEDAFWDAAAKMIGDEGAHAVLAQAARELLLAQSSDWQFIISTGAVRDYGERRFVLHTEALEGLLGSLKGDLEGGRRMAAELALRDDLFPNVLDDVAAALVPRTRSRPAAGAKKRAVAKARR